MDNYTEISSKLKTLLGLKGSPVAVRLIKEKSEIPAGVPELKEKIRHCEMVQKARAGDVFYATKEQHACAGGAGAMGITETPEKIRTGEFYFGLGRFKTLESAKKTMDAVPRTNKHFVASLYAPLEKATFVPDVVVVIGNPKQLLKIAQSNIYEKGGRNIVSFSGIQSVCADAVAQVYNTGEMNATFGCDGSRKFAKIADDELIVGIPAAKLAGVVEALEKITK
ncbi:MAG TPA: DUF169 domain-containing protein [Methanocella sp.]|uniref:DUF169 domain-containing protein n=1 Tax=Methanocella sp. TaxID=2052833 RepID=UPI002CE2B162|nr:DUF169 domain-containing protein [Methanocella sp.]HTY91473.1 DUF169 domain-containing protein [Methanocella sp.]